MFFEITSSADVIFCAIFWLVAWLMGTSTIWMAIKNRKTQYRSLIVFVLMTGIIFIGMGTFAGLPLLTV